MFIALTPQQQALQQEIRTYFRSIVSDQDARELLHDRHGPVAQRIVRRLGADGWLGVGWPKEFGGRGFGALEQQIFESEAVRASIPLSSVTLQTVGPTLLRYGTHEQKQRFLPGILRGEIEFAIGYTEPDAGTDLFSLTTTAKKQSDGSYLVNGQKTYTTGGHTADYIWLAARTGTRESRHRGLSILIVDTKDPGFSCTPIISLDGAHHTNATYFRNVRVPASMLVGEENNGVEYLISQLNHERVMLSPSGRIAAIYDLVYQWAVAAGLLDRDDVRECLGEILAVLRVNDIMNWRVVASTGPDGPSQADASASKVFHTTRVQRVARIAEDIVYAWGDFADPLTAQTVKALDVHAKRNVVITFGGGVNEVMRDMVSEVALGLPKVGRR
ncbi:acyl-CoA dehydrogenase family protein [Nocardia africana]|uniref:Acyl-CoA dehydrogenase fadE12 n=1 Tax=Nocardia africana TaxID=134964 RepID=A0A378WX18_9NOCA|nr:acyl-CoA dehydrogenase family protein [Nocardia africana]MCC3312939.1 acyl-CoA dehydrogenase family protein [Nocardia africana]SUA45719.1 Acyl-CoA dehydrogenase fadE12 [Nocardia africana]